MNYPIGRRSMLRFLAQGAGAFTMTHLAASCQSSSGQATSNQNANSEIARTLDTTQWTMPDETAPHARTWMAFGASRQIWGSDMLEVVQDNLALIARTIAQYEPVTMVVRREEEAIAAQKCGTDVELVVAPLDDLWMRDIGPVFVQNPDGIPGAINFNFNGWGNKQTHRKDAKIADFVIAQTEAQPVQAPITLEGGAIEVDGNGTALMTESSILNSNRNPGLTKQRCEEILKPLLGLRKIIWLPGIRDRDITDGHIDFYARFVRPGVVVAATDPNPQSFDHAVTKTHLKVLEQATDANGNPLEIVTIDAPRTVRPTFNNPEFAAGYINFYVINGAVLIPEFGDPRADRYAQETLQSLFPQRKIIALNIDGIAAGGGGIHCTTQQQPQL
ncbi:MAG: agmatine deiminase family protein [Cyanobacteria bacterium P01_C01_bin.89]